MTVPAGKMMKSPNQNQNDPEPNPDSPIFIACLVTDKKYRKMGGEEGLKGAIKRSGNGNIFIGQLRVEELVKNEDFGGNLKRFIENQNQNQNQKNPKSSFNSLLDKKIILVHKYSDFYKLSIEGDQVEKIRTWLESQGSLIKILDDPEKIDLLSDRARTGNLVRKLCISEGFESRGLQWPAFTEKNINFDDLKFPVIIKPIDACATDESHWMTLIRDISALTCAQKKSLKFPRHCLIQQFYEHFGILYKVYVIGSEVIEIIARPSISPCQPIYRFNTHKFKISEGELSPEKQIEAMERLEEHKPLILEFTRRLKIELGLTWFGVDVIIPNSINSNSEIKVAVIDVNYMPGYDGTRDLSDKLIKAIME